MEISHWDRLRHSPFGSKRLLETSRGSSDQTELVGSNMATSDVAPQVMRWSDSQTVDDVKPFLTTSQVTALEKLVLNMSCPLCHELLNDPMTTECLHTFCASCIEKHLHAARGNRSCPSCSYPQIKSQLRPNGRAREFVTVVRRLKSNPLVSQVAPHQDGNVSSNDSIIPATLTSLTMEVEPTQMPIDKVEGGSEEAHDSKSALMIEVKQQESRLGCQPLPVDSQTMDTFRSVLSKAKTNLTEIESVLHHRTLPVKTSAVPKSATGAIEEARGNVSQSRIILYSGLSNPARIEQLKSTLGLIAGVNIIDSSDATYGPPAPTHLIIAAQESATTGDFRCIPTYKYFWALSVGIHIIREQWLDMCAKSPGEWVDETPFRVYASSSEFSQSRTFNPPRLFQGMRVVLGPFSSSSVVFNRQQCHSLLTLNDAKVFEADGHEDGSGVVVNDGIKSEFEQAKDRKEEVVIIVGHPKDLFHNDNTCRFCKNVFGAFKQFGKVRILDCAWVMLCLDSMCVKSLDEYALAVSE